MLSNHSSVRASQRTDKIPQATDWHEMLSKCIYVIKGSSQMNYSGVPIYDKLGNRIKNPMLKKNQKPYFSVNNIDMSFQHQMITKSINYTRDHVIGKLKKLNRNQTPWSKQSKKMVTLNNVTQHLIILAYQGRKPPKRYRYQDIVEVIEHPYSDQVRLEKERTVQKKWSYEFHVVIKDQMSPMVKEVYKFYATCSDEKDLWLHTFNWIIQSNFYLKEDLERKAVKVGGGMIEQTEGGKVKETE